MFLQFFYFNCVESIVMKYKHKNKDSQFFSSERKNVPFQTDDGAGSDGSLPESWSSLNDDKCFDAVRELVNHHVSKLYLFSNLIIILMYELIPEVKHNSFLSKVLSWICKL